MINVSQLLNRRKAEQQTVLVPGDYFIAYDLYNMHDVGLGEFQTCHFLHWSEDGKEIRLHDMTNDTEFWCDPEEVIAVERLTWAQARQAVA